jgi:hypothetical protein
VLWAEIIESFFQIGNNKSPIYSDFPTTAKAHFSVDELKEVEVSIIFKTQTDLRPWHNAGGDDRDHE